MKGGPWVQSLLRELDPTCRKKKTQNFMLKLRPGQSDTKQKTNKLKQHVRLGPVLL